MEIKLTPWEKLAIIDALELLGNQKFAGFYGIAGSHLRELLVQLNSADDIVLIKNKF